MKSAEGPIDMILCSNNRVKSKLFPLAGPKAPFMHSGKHGPVLLSAAYVAVIVDDMLDVYSVRSVTSKADKS